MRNLKFLYNLTCAPQWTVSWKKVMLLAVDIVGIFAKFSLFQKTKKVSNLLS